MAVAICFLPHGVREANDKQSKSHERLFGRGSFAQGGLSAYEHINSERAIVARGLGESCAMRRLTVGQLRCHLSQTLQMGLRSVLSSKLNLAS